MTERSRFSDVVDATTSLARTKDQAKTIVASDATRVRYTHVNNGFCIAYIGLQMSNGTWRERFVIEALAGQPVGCFEGGRRRNTPMAVGKLASAVKRAEQRMAQAQ